ncbi:MAG: DUF3054 domain-containing protein [Acidimicrobiales bacterium]|jgi:DUF3054 family protein
MRKAGVLADLVAVFVFVGIGRAVHSHGLGLAGLVSTAWPFVAGLAAGWLALSTWRRDPSSLLGGSVVLGSTVALGMALRVVSGQGTAAAFILVALAFLGATMLGWRVASAFVRPRRPARRSP